MEYILVICFDPAPEHKLLVAFKEFVKPISHFVLKFLLFQLQIILFHNQTFVILGYATNVKES